MKKMLSLALALTMVLTMLVGCATKPVETNAPETNAPGTNAPETQAPTEPAAEDVTITLGIWPEDTMTDAIEVHKGYVETMKTLHPNVTCEPAYYKYSTDTFMALVESHTVPTIFESWYTEPQKLIKAGAIADITDQLEARGWLDKMNPAIRTLLSDENGRVYGIPRDGYALGLMCNAALFREAGVVDADGYPVFPKTWDELFETAKTINEKTGAAGLCLLAQDNAGGWHFSNIAWAFGANLTIDNGDGTYKSNLNTPEAIAAMEFVKKMWDAGLLTADPTTENWGTGFTQLGTGAAAMYIAANDAVDQPTVNNGLPLEDLGLCAIPAGPGGQYSLMGGTPYFFSKDATPEEIDAALDYLEIMGKAPVATESAIAGMKADAQYRVDNGIPVIPRFPAWVDKDYAAAEAAVIAEYSNVDTKLYQTYFDATAGEGGRLEEPGLTQDMYAELTKVLQAIVTDKNADIPALMAEADANYQAILDANQ